NGFRNCCLTHHVKTNLSPQRVARLAGEYFSSLIGVKHENGTSGAEA
ncbi:hypothetical protein SAMN05444746_1361, partial [Variovorax sp. OK212]